MKLTVLERDESLESLHNWLQFHKAMTISTTTSTDDDPFDMLRGLDNRGLEWHPSPQQERDVINDTADDTVLFDDFARWFKFTFYPELHNRVGNRLVDYSLSSSLQANRTDPRKLWDKKMDKKMDKNTSPKNKKVPYQSALLRPADLLNDQSSFNDYARDNNGTMQYADDDEDGASPVVNTRAQGLPSPPRVQAPIFEPAYGFYHLLGNLHSRASSNDLLLSASEPPEPHISPSFDRPKTAPSDSFMYLQPPTISVPSLLNPFEGMWPTENDNGSGTESGTETGNGAGSRAGTDPFFDLTPSSWQLPKILIPSSLSENTEQGVDNNQTKTPVVLRKSQNQNYFSWT